jgi:iron complex transport system substrate-binding protein
VLAVAGFAVGQSCEEGTRAFEHFADTTCVPENPQRIVTTQDQNGLLPLLELGVRPVGSAGRVFEDGTTQFRRVQGFDTTGIASVGSYGEPNLEAIAALQPDLIVGHEFNEQIYDQLSQIAPTVLIQIFGGRPLDDVLFDFAELVGRTEAAEVFQAGIEGKVAALQSRVDEMGGTLSVSIIGPASTPGDFWRGDGGQATGTVMNRYLDLPRPPAQAEPGINMELQSIEALPDHDADVLLVLDFSGESQSPQIQSFLSSPLFGALASSEAGQAFVIDGTQTVGAAWGKMGAFLDELVRILLDPDIDADVVE